MKRIFVVLLVVLLLHISSLLFVASVEQSIYCDPIPQDLIDMVDGVSQDCIAFDAPDGSAYQYTTFSPRQSSQNLDMNQEARGPNH